MLKAKFLTMAHPHHSETSTFTMIPCWKQRFDHMSAKQKPKFLTMTHTSHVETSIFYNKTCQPLWDQLFDHETCQLGHAEINVFTTTHSRHAETLFLYFSPICTCSPNYLFLVSSISTPVQYRPSSIYNLSCQPLHLRLYFSFFSVWLLRLNFCALFPNFISPTVNKSLNSKKNGNAIKGKAAETSCVD